MFALVTWISGKPCVLNWQTSRVKSSNSACCVKRFSVLCKPTLRGVFRNRIFIFNLHTYTIFSVFRMNKGFVVHSSIHYTYTKPTQSLHESGI